VAPRNPITERLELLYAQWTEFSLDADRRVLRWLIRDDEARMIEAFVGIESSEGGRLPVLFSRLCVPFAGSHTYGFALRDRLLDDIEHEATQSPLLRGFSPPPPREEDEGRAGLVALAEALVKHVRARGTTVEQLALVILPPPLADGTDWARFVAKLATCLANSEIRAIVIDRLDAPVLDTAAESSPAVIASVPAKLDMPGAIREVSARAGKLDAPAGKFRQAYTAMLDAIGKHDMAAALRWGEVASLVARAQGWWHLLVGVGFCLGTGYLDAKRPTDAAQWFRRAEEPLNGPVPPLGASDEPMLVSTLRLRCRLGLGAACYFAGAFEQTAIVYGGAAEIAHAMGDKLAELDARRMQSHCLERAGKLDDAWTRGLEGVAVGAELSSDDRKLSTLPYLGRALLQLTGRSSMGHRRIAIRAQLDALLGTGWEAA
jgi:hypothetical protein